MSEGLKRLQEELSWALYEGSISQPQYDEYIKTAIEQIEKEHNNDN